MYEYKNTTYAEAGYILQGNRAVGMWLPSAFGPFSERELDLSNLAVTHTEVAFDIFHWKHSGIRSYADAKKFIISKRYSNDDQLAIILNKDDSDADALAFNKMQEWREWASLVAHQILSLL